VPHISHEEPRFLYDIGIETKGTPEDQAPTIAEAGQACGIMHTLDRAVPIE
jgi:hypothetical protein